VKKADKRNLILYSVLLVCVAVGAFFAGALWYSSTITNESADLISDLGIAIIPRDRDEEIDNPTIDFYDPPTPYPTEVPYDPYYEPEPEPEPVIPFVPVLDFDELRETFPSIVGWIQSEGTNINFPIVQGTDNDFYLYHLPNRVNNRYGSIFMDFRNRADFSDHNFNTFIYGHHMSSGGMFASLMQYQHQWFYEGHQTMFIFTPTANYELRIFAAYVIDNSVESPMLRLAGPESFYSDLENILARSLITSEVRPTFDDKLVYLVTCTNVRQMDRMLVVGILTNIGNIDV